MRRSDLLFKVLIYLSLIFLLYYLWKFDYLKTDVKEVNIGWGLFSIVFLWIGFILSAISWRFALYYHKIVIKSKTAIISHGLSVFAKYIPGKIWVILGRASFVSRNGKSLKDTSFISLKEQLLYILLGLIISTVPTLWYFKLNYISLILLGTCFLLVLILFNKKVHLLMEIVIRKIFRNKFTLPQLSFFLSTKLSVFILLYWFAWIIAFYCLNRAMIPHAGIINAFAFPLSVCYGVLAIIMPGGLGVREGLMAGFLIATGVSTELALSLSLVARLWFLTGEIFIFLFALFLNGVKKIKNQ